MGGAYKDCRLSQCATDHLEMGLMNGMGVELIDHMEMGLMIDMGVELIDHMEMGLINYIEDR